MEIEDILSADRIVTSLEAGSKKHALKGVIVFLYQFK